MKEEEKAKEIYEFCFRHAKGQTDDLRAIHSRILCFKFINEILEETKRQQKPKITLVRSTVSIKFEYSKYWQKVKNIIETKY